MCSQNLNKIARRPALFWHDFVAVCRVSMAGSVIIRSPEWNFFGAFYDRIALSSERSHDKNILSSNKVQIDQYFTKMDINFAFKASWRQPVDKSVHLEDCCVDH